MCSPFNPPPPLRNLFKFMLISANSLEIKKNWRFVNHAIFNSYVILHEILKDIPEEESTPFSKTPKATKVPRSTRCFAYVIEKK